VWYLFFKITVDEDQVFYGLVKLIKLAETTLPKDVVKSLEKAWTRESGIAKIQLGNILENIEVASQTNRPLCQDTGVQTFFLQIGRSFPLIGRLKPLLIDAVKQASEMIPLRPNAIDPFTKRQHVDNVGAFIPVINWDFIEGDSVHITVMPKGGGSENMSRLIMLHPSEGLEGVKEFVVREIVHAGGNPCPPTVVGIGIGGGADVAMKLGKLALLRPVGQRHEDKQVADFEEQLIEEINDSGVGPMGLGGKTTVLDVHVEKAPRHPASLPVGMVVQCWANRRAIAYINSEGHFEVIK
jgi:fumarate hydratase subunit alpha